MASASGAAGARPADDERREQWELAEGRPELAELEARRRRFVIAALAVFVIWFGAFLVLAGYARGFMGTAVVGSITWAYVLALSIILLTWVLTWAYLRYADRHLEPLAERAAGPQAQARVASADEGAAGARAAGARDREP